MKTDQEAMQPLYDMVRASGPGVRPPSWVTSRGFCAESTPKTAEFVLQFPKKIQTEFQLTQWEKTCIIYNK